MEKNATELFYQMKEEDNHKSKFNGEQTNHIVK